MEVDYAEIVTDKPVKKFLLKYYLTDTPMESLILISPFLGTLEGTRVTLDAICRKALERGVFTYVITCKPGEDQQGALDCLLRYDRVEVRFNESLHAKLYICICKEESDSFALLGSANLTRNSIMNNIEIGMMIYGRGKGKDIVRGLSSWGLEKLRTFNNTQLVKKIKSPRR